MNGTYSRLLPIIACAIVGICFAPWAYEQYGDSLPFSARALRRAIHRPPRRIPLKSAHYAKPVPIERARAPPR